MEGNFGGAGHLNRLLKLFTFPTGWERSKIWGGQKGPFISPRQDCLIFSKCVMTDTYLPDETKVLHQPKDNRSEKSLPAASPNLGMACLVQFSSSNANR